MIELQDLTAEKANVRGAVEGYLVSAFDMYPPTEVREAARYAALGGGHCWRAIVTVAAGRIFCDDALDVTLPGACGMELAHAASLVLDDLPSMDNAEVRRGKPCTHPEPIGCARSSARRAGNPTKFNT
jgi:geranylgeranyl diphosphate synthase type II